MPPATRNMLMKSFQDFCKRRGTQQLSITVVRKLFLHVDPQLQYNFL